MYRLKLSRREKRKLRRAKWLILLAAVLGVALIVWLAWIRPLQKGFGINSFGQCAAAGHPIQESYPEVCLTDDGKRFTNPGQQTAHQASLDGGQELLPPTDPALLKLDVEEWDITIPLTEATFDLTYAYFDLNGEQYLLFTYKRLLREGVCKGDVGLKVFRRSVKYDPPYSSNRPAPLASAGKAYFYPDYEDKKKCYDVKNAGQVALVKEIAGDKTLAKAAAALVSKLKTTPKE